MLKREGEKRFETQLLDHNKSTAASDLNMLWPATASDDHLQRLCGFFCIVDFTERTITIPAAIPA